MKRSEALAVLSRDHHQALAVALVLRRATEASLQDALERFHGYFDTRGSLHFDVEEQLIVPVLNDLPGGAPLGERMVREHADLRALAAAAGESAQAAAALGDALNEHVRFEERQVFPLIEAELPDPELAALGEQLAEADR